MYLPCIQGLLDLPDDPCPAQLGGKHGPGGYNTQAACHNDGMINQSRIIPVVHHGWVKALPSYKLVPGDVVVLQNGKATCDMVLLRGSCLVEESMLSGEVMSPSTSSGQPKPI